MKNKSNIPSTKGRKTNKNLRSSEKMTFGRLNLLYNVVEIQIRGSRPLTTKIKEQVSELWTDLIKSNREEEVVTIRRLQLDV